MINYYQLLNIDSEASFAEIKEAYRRLVLEAHPDKTPSNPNQLQPDIRHILQAWKVLSDVTSRARYDAQLQAETTHSGIIQEEIDLDDMDFVENDLGNGYFASKCRCGGSFLITEEDLENGVNVISCTSCSLNANILYAQAN